MVPWIRKGIVNEYFSAASQVDFAPTSNISTWHCSCLGAYVHSFAEGFNFTRVFRFLHISLPGGCRWTGFLSWSHMCNKKWKTTNTGD